PRRQLGAVLPPLRREGHLRLEPPRPRRPRRRAHVRPLHGQPRRDRPRADHPLRHVRRLPHVLLRRHPPRLRLEPTGRPPDEPRAQRLRGRLGRGAGGRGPPVPARPGSRAMRRCALLPLLLLAAGCAERPAEGGDPARGEAAPAEEVSVGYTVRGVFLGALYDGQAATVRHEAVPGLMPAMEMDFRVADPALLEGWCRATRSASAWRTGG